MCVVVIVVGERYKILLPRGTAQPTSSQAEAHTEVMPTQQAYESFSDVGEIRVYFASKILTPCRMH